MAETDNRSLVRHRALQVLDAQFTVNCFNQIHAHAAMQPRDCGDRKLQIAGDDCATPFERVNDEVHARRGVRRQSNLFRFGIDKLCDASSHRLAPLNPLIPARIAFAHHHLVKIGRRVHHRTRNGASRRAVQIRSLLRHGKIAPDVFPINLVVHKRSSQ